MVYETKEDNLQLVDTYTLLEHGCDIIDTSDSLSEVQFTFKCPTGSVYQCSAMYTDGPSTLSQVLFDKVERKTRTPVDLQMLQFQGQLIESKIPLCEYSLENGSCLTLLVKGLGGGGPTEGDSSSGENRKLILLKNNLNSF